MRQALLFGLVTLAACVKDPPATGTTSATPSALAPTTTAAPNAAPPVVARDAPRPPSPLVVAVPVPGHFTIEASRETSVATVARLERKTGSGWEELQNLDLGAGYRLFETCPASSVPAPRCTTITPGKLLAPPPWQGFGCSAQCNGSCRANAWEGPGTFRLVVHACDGGPLVESPPFDLPDPGSSGREAFGRFGIATGIARGTVVRLVLDGAARDAIPLPAKDRVFGYRTVPGSARPLVGGDLEALATLLRNPKGFDDAIQKRCLMKTLVGFELERTVPTSAGPRTETIELAIDLACMKALAVRGEGAARVVLGSHFDPSRAGFLALVKRALPDDKEIAAAR